MLTKIIAQANVDHVEKWFDRAEKLVIVSHVSPDGDAIGSSLGLYHFLVSQEKTVHVIAVSVRTRKGEDLGAMTPDAFIAKCLMEIATKSKEV